jgi:hypothetical protein
LTLPTNIILPSPTSNPDEIIKYQQELVSSLQRMYEDLADKINGDFRSEYGQQGDTWTPILKGTTNTGSFTYTNQTGWTLRKGIMVDAWFDISWTGSGGATGNLYVELPYEVVLSNGMPFVGLVQSSGITYTGGTGIVINAIQNTFRGELWNVGSGFSTARQAVVSNGRLIGNIRYIGVEFESS